MPDKDLMQRVELWIVNELADAMDEARGPVTRADYIRDAIARSIEDGVRGRIGARAGGSDGAS